MQDFVQKMNIRLTVNILPGKRNIKDIIGKHWLVCIGIFDRLELIGGEGKGDKITKKHSKQVFEANVITFSLYELNFRFIRSC